MITTFAVAGRSLMWSASCCSSCNGVAASATLVAMVHQRRKPASPLDASADGARGSVERIRTALELVAGRGWMSASELALALGVDRSTGWRLARSLEHVGWLQRDPVSGRYRLGMALFELGTRVLDTIDVRDEARRVMTELVAS